MYKAVVVNMPGTFLKHILQTNVQDRTGCSERLAQLLRTQHDYTFASEHARRARIMASLHAPSNSPS